MSKCRPNCCSSSNGEGSGAALIGFIVLIVVVYVIIRAIVRAAEAIMHTVIEIIEITAITVGSIAAVVLLAFITVQIMRYRRRQSDRPSLKVNSITLDPAVPPVAVTRGYDKLAFEAPAIPAIDAAQLFAEAVSSPDMDPRFVERILRNVMDRTDQ